jgi:hypothetical protein
LASSYRYAIVSSFAKVAMPSVSDIVGEELIHLKQIAEGPMSITARRAFLNDAENVLQNQPEPWKTWTNVKQAVDSILTMMPRKQQAADNEMQARLHNGNVRGYSRWGRIPASPDELVAALWDLGVKPSNEVKNFMRSPHQKQLRAIFNKYSQQTGYVAAPIAELNIGLNYFRSEEVVERFYRDYLHVMYGDLLVKYGDSQGLERMGFSSTERDLLGMPVPLKALPAPTPMGP